MKISNKNRVKVAPVLEEVEYLAVESVRFPSRVQIFGLVLFLFFMALVWI